ncbi:MAG: mechanosensitive ion channel [Bacteroidota bacterium]|nr:mechanosensitive ion channel [Bacteroidota bacterium]
MEQFLHYRFLDNSILSYLYVLGVILLALLIKRFISRLLADKLISLITKRKQSFRKDAFLKLVVFPIERFLLISIALASFDKLNFPHELDFDIHKVTSSDIIHSLAAIVWVWVFIRLCIRVTEFIAVFLQEKASLSVDKSENQLIVFFKDFFKVIFIIIGVLLVLRLAFNKDITSLLTGLSIVGAAVALATKESLENLIASFIIFFDKPFAMGDIVKVQNFTGTIEKIGLRSTRIRTDIKTFITVPNKQMVDTIIDNVSLRTQRKIELRLEISISTSKTQIKQLVAAVKEYLQQKEAVENNTVFFADTGKNAHVIAIDCFTTIAQPIEAFNALREDINLYIIELMEQLQIELAAANTTVVVSNK